MMKNKSYCLIIGLLTAALVTACKNEAPEDMVPSTQETTVEETTTRPEIPETTQPETKSEEMDGGLVASFPTDLLPIPEGDVEVSYSSVAGERSKSGFYANATVQVNKSKEELAAYYETFLRDTENFDSYWEAGIGTIKGTKEKAEITINLINGNAEGKTMVALLATVEE